MGYVPAHWEEFGRIPPQCGHQNYGSATTEGNIWDVGITLSGGGDFRGGPAGEGDLLHRPPEKICTEKFEQARYGPVSSGRETTREKCV